MKLFAMPALYKEGRWDKIFRYEADIAILWQPTRLNLEPLLAELRPFVDEGQMAELRNIVDEIRRKVERVGRI